MGKRIQGKYFSSANIELTLQWSGGSFESMDIAGFSLNQSLKPGPVRGFGPHKLGRTTGEYDCGAELTIFQDAYTQLIDALAAADPDGSYGVPEFNVHAVWEVNGVTVEVLAEQCRITGDASDHKQGTEPNSIKVPLDVMIMCQRRNGGEWRYLIKPPTA